MKIKKLKKDFLIKTKQIKTKSLILLVKFIPKVSESSYFCLIFRIGSLSKFSSKRFIQHNNIFPFVEYTHVSV